MSLNGIFSLDAALAGVDHDREIFTTLAELFVTGGPKDLTAAQAALAARDGAALARSAHRLKGALLQFGAPTVLAAAEELEQLGERGSFDCAAAVYARLEEELWQLITALRETLLKGLDS